MATKLELTGDRLILHVQGADRFFALAAGRFYSRGELSFWNVHDPERAIAIRLRDERYTRLVIEVDDPPAEIARTQAALVEKAA